MKSGSDRRLLRLAALSLLGAIGTALLLVPRRTANWIGSNLQAIEVLLKPIQPRPLDNYAALTTSAKASVMQVMLKQYENLESEKRMLQQLANAVLAFLVAGVVAAVVAYAQVQATLAHDIVTVAPRGTPNPAFEAAMRSANVIVALIPPSMLAGGLVMMSLHARTRRISFFCAYVEHVLNSVAGGTVRAIGWETVSLALPRGRGWTRYVFGLGLVLAAISFVTVEPIVDRGGTPIDPMLWTAINALLAFLLLLAAASHWVDQRYYRGALGEHFGSEWKDVDPWHSQHGT